MSREITNLAGMFPSLVGMIALGIIVVAVAFSIRFARRRLPYEAWHAVHVFLYAAVTLALIHQFYEGKTFRQPR